jgi:membrane-associated HD superfamily phosphohydrolase
LSSTSTASEDCDICETQSATTITEPNSKADKNKTRKKREELSISATKSIKKEKVEIVVSFE